MASSSRVQHILSLAADLSKDEREEITAELLSALEPGEAVSPGEWNDAWRDEIARRAADPSPGVPLAQVRERVNEALASARLGRERR